MSKQIATWQNPAELKAMLEEMKVNLAFLESLIASMQSGKIKDVIVPMGYSEMDRGLIGAVTFLNSLAVGIHSYRHLRGDFAGRSVVDSLVKTLPTRKRREPRLAGKPAGASGRAKPSRAKK